MNNPGDMPFEQLIREHRGIILKICSLFARNQDDFNDLFQEISIQLWKSLKRFEGKSKLSTWIYRVALNTALLDYRKKVSAPTVMPLNEPVWQMADQSNGPEEEDFILLRNAIQQLASLDKAIILLYLEEHSYQEIAEITGLSVSNVSVRILRIKQKIKVHMQKQGYQF